MVKKNEIFYKNKFLFNVFFSKPNKGVFVAFNKVIMAWSET
jgi:hypothetical protein